MSFELDKPKAGGVNLFAKVSCRTCGGARMVVYSTRANPTTSWMKDHGLAAKGETEEYAPCPDCNASCNTGRQDHHSPDSARVREQLKR